MSEGKPMTRVFDIEGSILDGLKDPEFAKEWLAAQDEELAALRSENEKLRAALEPFAKMHTKLMGLIEADEWSDDDHVPTGMQYPSVKLGDLRRAKACITQSQIEEAGTADTDEQQGTQEA